VRAEIGYGEKASQRLCSKKLEEGNPAVGFPKPVRSGYPAATRATFESACCPNFAHLHRLAHSIVPALQLDSRQSLPQYLPAELTVTASLEPKLIGSRNSEFMIEIQYPSSNRL